MKSLRILNASGECGINQNGICGLDLIELDVSGNKKITNAGKKYEIFFTVFVKNENVIFIFFKCIHDFIIKNIICTW